jgi:hypothetical protein
MQASWGGYQEAIMVQMGMQDHPDWMRMPLREQLMDTTAIADQVGMLTRRYCIGIMPMLHQNQRTPQLCRG